MKSKTRFTLNNVGTLDSGNIELGDLTVICGPNNSGKTYLSYAIHGFYKYIFEAFELDLDKKHYLELQDSGSCKIDLTDYEKKASAIFEKISREYSGKLDIVFSTNEDHFKGSKFSCSLSEVKPDYKSKYERTLRTKKQEIVKISKDFNSKILEISSLSDDGADLPSKFMLKGAIGDSVLEIIFGDHLLKPFAITSERTGISLFYKELDINKNVMIEYLTTKRDRDSNFDPFHLLSEVHSRYAICIKDNIDVVRDYDLHSKSKSYLQKDSKTFSEITKSLDKIINGSYKIIGKQVYFVPNKERNRDRVSPLPIYLTSSSIKSLMMLDTYIRFLAQSNDILIIDEPELNLHPVNQVLVAKLLARLVNCGVRVLITTHSDYIVKELNNLIMLSNEFPERDRLIKKYKYDKQEFLNPNNVRVYSTSKNHVVEEVNVGRFGIELDLFDEIIVNENEKSNDIYYSLGE